MKESKVKKVFWENLPKGFHHRRIGTKKIGIECFVWKGEPGEVVLVNGSTHGDEYEGPTFLMSLVNTWRPLNLRGTVVVVPILNEEAFKAGVRCRPDDGKDLSRVFPGKANGSSTEQLANLCLNELVRHSNYWFDFHSAGSFNEIAQFVGYYTHPNRKVNAAQEKMAACFDRYWRWASPALPGRTASAAHKLNIPFNYTESRGAGFIMSKDLKMLRDGFFEFLKRFNFIKGKKRKLRRQPARISNRAQETFLQTTHLAPATGLLRLKVKVRDTIKKGQIIGHVYPLDGSPVKSIKAENSGKVAVLNLKGTTLKGGPTVTIAPIKGKI